MDMFLKPKTRSKQFMDWCKAKQLFSSVDIARYEYTNYYIRAHRTVRELCEKGVLRRLPLDEKLFRGLVKKENQNIGYYEWRNDEAI